MYEHPDTYDHLDGYDPDAYDQYPLDYDGTAMDMFYPQSAFIRQPVSEYRLFDIDCALTDDGFAA